MSFSLSHETSAIPSRAKTGVGICLSDPTDRDHVFAASTQMAMETAVVGDHTQELTRLKNFELIIADESVARSLVARLTERDGEVEGMMPAIVAVARHSVHHTNGNKDLECNFDGVLEFPMTSAEIAMQLRAIVYAHRAFARRYQAAWSELRLNRRIFRSVTTGISVASATLPDMPLVYVNPAFEAMTGYSRAEVQGRNCRFLEGIERNQPGLTVVRNALANRRKGVAVLKNFRKDGTPFWNELSLSPITNDKGELTHYVGIQTDVTSRVEFEAALRESEKLAVVGRLAASIAHEINNPLASVMNLIYIAERTECSQDTKDQLAVADRELRRVKLITEQALRFSRQSTKPQSTSSSDLLDPILDLYQGHARNARVLMSKRERSSLPLVCMESEIRQVLNNLVSNAIYAMRERGGRLVVRSREATGWSSNGRGLLFTVADTGTGMSAEILSNIYQAFFSTKGIGGTGLGLWISCEIVERHRGKFKVKSAQQPGRAGTVFQVFLPYEGIMQKPDHFEVSQLS